MNCEVEFPLPMGYFSGLCLFAGGYNSLHQYFQLYVDSCHLW